MAARSNGRNAVRRLDQAILKSFVVVFLGVLCGRVLADGNPLIGASIGRSKEASKLNHEGLKGLAEFRARRPIGDAQVIAGVETDAAPAPAASAPVTSSAQQAFDDLNSWRTRHAAVIWGRRPATPEQLRAVLADLDQGLAQANEPGFVLAAMGSPAVWSRRLEFQVDRAKVLERLGDRAGAVRALDAAATYSWIDPRGFGGPDGDTELRAILDDPRAAGVRARYDIARRLGDASALNTPYTPQMSAADRVAGLSRLWSVVRDGFVWFDHVPALDWDREYLDALPRVLAAQNTAAYYRELQRFVALLKDAHSDVLGPEALAAQWYARPGLSTRMIAGRVVVTHVADAALGAAGARVGDELLTVNGRDVQAYAQAEVAPFQSSSTAQDLAVRTYEYMLLAGNAGQPVHLNLAHADGTRFDLTAPRQLRAWPLAEPRQAWTSRPDGVVVLRAGQFEDEAAAELMRQHADDLLRARGLVIDLRHNGGGLSSAGMRLLSWLQDAPVPVTLASVRADTPYTLASSGGRLWPKWQQLDDAPGALPHEHTFNGPVAMLIDAGTLSAAEDTAASFKLMRRGPLIGTRSGGSTGQPLSFRLPGGGWARICVKRDSYPDGTDFVGTGVQPDLVAETTVADVRTGRDSVLERAVQTVLGR